MSLLLSLALLTGLPAHGQEAALSSATTRPITLEEAYRVALQRNEQLAQNREAVAELIARIDELWSSVKPRVSLVGSEIVQDSPGDLGGFAASFAAQSRPQAAVNVHQPLFSGLREFLAVKSAHASKESAELSVRRAEQRLYQDVAAAYLQLAAVQKEIVVRQDIAVLTNDRIRELRSRERVGRSRRSEVLASESQLSQVESEIAAARGRERVAQFNLRFITGLDTDLLPADVSVSTAPSLEDYLRRSLTRADVEAKRRDADAARYNIDIQRRQMWPTLAADANYYLKRPPGFLSDIKWDATLSASLPLYWGGAISAQTRQAEARERSARQALSLVERQADTEVRSSYGDLLSSLSILQALDKALSLARRNADAQSGDYRLGLVTNLEVLNALNTVQETRLRLDQARLNAYASLTRLEVAAGGPRIQ